MENEENWRMWTSEFAERGARKGQGIQVAEGVMVERQHMKRQEILKREVWGSGSPFGPSLPFSQVKTLGARQGCLRRRDPSEGGVRSTGWEHGLQVTGM